MLQHIQYTKKAQSQDSATESRNFNAFVNGADGRCIILAEELVGGYERKQHIAKHCDESDGY